MDMPAKGKSWEHSEDEFLMAHYETMTHEEIANQLGRSKSGVLSRCSQLRLIKCHYWTAEEDHVLRVNYLTMNHKEIGGIIGRSNKSVGDRCSLLGLRKEAPAWTEAEDKLLQQLYSQMEHEEIGRVMGRSRHSVRNRCSFLKLRKEAPLWTKDEDDLLRQLYSQFEEHLFLDSVAEQMGKSRAAIAGRASKLKLTRHDRPRALSQIRKQLVSVARFEGTRNGLGSRTNGGFRADIGIYVRSSWEANYARYLNWLKEQGEIKEWQYEIDTFQFPIKRGTRFYTPDFRVLLPDGTKEYHEVKGYMSPQSKTALDRMARYYPGEKVIVIDGSSYKDIRKKLSKVVPNWEDPYSAPIPTWPQADEALVMKLWEGGVPVKAIAQQLGKSVDAVAVRAQRLGARRPMPWPRKR